MCSMSVIEREWGIFREKEKGAEQERGDDWPRPQRVKRSREMIERKKREKIGFNGLGL